MNAYQRTMFAIVITCSLVIVTLTAGYAWLWVVFGEPAGPGDWIGAVSLALALGFIQAFCAYGIREALR